MRHVSRTHRVALDWLFDRINLDPKIQIRYIDTKHQIADMLTNGNFTRDEWNNLLHLFNISHFSSLCCAKNFSLICCTKRLPKRMQEQKEDNRIVAKSRPTAMNLAVSVSTSSLSVNSPTASRSPEILKASSRQIGFSGRHVVSANSNFLSRRSVEFSRMAMGCFAGHKHRETCSSRQASEVSESSGGINYKHRGTCSIWDREYPGNPETPLDSQDSESKIRIWPHHFSISPDCVPHMEKVLSIIRRIMIGNRRMI